MHWLLGRKSQLSLANKLLLYKCVLKPVWTYGIQLWGCAKPSHTQIIQRLQSKILRSISDRPWYVSHFTLHNDLRIPFVATEITRLSQLYHHRLARHHNPLVTELAALPHYGTPTEEEMADRPTPRFDEGLNLVFYTAPFFTGYDGVSLLDDFSPQVYFL
jgi:hypothetical protein